MTYAQYCRLGLHISATNRKVVRAAHGLLSDQGRSSSMRVTRHKWLQSMLAEHAAARAIVNQFRL
jgi:hypothetical protein